MSQRGSSSERMTVLDLSASIRENPDRGFFRPINRSVGPPVIPRNAGPHSKQGSHSLLLFLEKEDGVFPTPCKHGVAVDGDFWGVLSQIDALFKGVRTINKITHFFWVWPVERGGGHI